MGPNKGGSSLVHIALFVIQFNFAIGTVLAKIGMVKLNPIVFAFYREVAAGIVLGIVARYLYPNERFTTGIRAILWTGLCVFGTQIFSIIGIKLATNAVDFAIWQPVQPVLVLCVSIYLGWERLNKARAFGILSAFFGCVLVVLVSTTTDNTTTALLLRRIAANIFFFLSCACGVGYQILSKPILRIYPSICIAAWCYGIASMLTIPTALGIAASSHASTFLCPECNHHHNFFYVPLNAMPTLLWWIGPSTIINYALQLWAIQQTSPTLVTAYSALQPVLATIFTLTLLFFFASRFECQHHQSYTCLDNPTYYHFIACFLVLTGLALIISSEAQAVLFRSGHSTMHQQGSSCSSLIAAEDLPCQLEDTGDPTFSPLQPSLRSGYEPVAATDDNKKDEYRIR